MPSDERRMLLTQRGDVLMLDSLLSEVFIRDFIRQLAVEVSAAVRSLFVTICVDCDHRR